MTDVALDFFERLAAQALEDTGSLLTVWTMKDKLASVVARRKA